MYVLTSSISTIPTVNNGTEAWRPHGNMEMLLICDDVLAQESDKTLFEFPHEISTRDGVTPPAFTVPVTIAANSCQTAGTVPLKTGAS